MGGLIALLVVNTIIVLATVAADPTDPVRWDGRLSRLVEDTLLLVVLSKKNVLLLLVLLVLLLPLLLLLLSQLLLPRLL